MVQIIWREKAENNLREIAQYIAQNSVEQAIRVSKMIHEKPEMLRLHPEIGAIVPEFKKHSIRELHVFQYRIFYRFVQEDNEIEILGVVHGARQLTDEMLEE